jgi:hypothetical protein
VVEERRGAVDMLEHADLPDPVTEVIRNLAASQDDLRERLERLEGSPDVLPAGVLERNVAREGEAKA